MYNANILRAEITNFVSATSYVTHHNRAWTVLFQNSFENGMLTSSVLRYTPLLPKSPQIFLRPFPEKSKILLTSCVHPNIPQHSNTSYHAWRRQCVLSNHPHNPQHSCIIGNSPEAETTMWSSHLWWTPQSLAIPLHFGSFRVVRPYIQI